MTDLGGVAFLTDLGGVAFLGLAFFALAAAGAIEARLPTDLRAGVFLAVAGAAAGLGDCQCMGGREGRKE